MKLLKSLIHAFLVALALTATSNAMDFKVAKISSVNYGFDMSGEIVAGDSERFRSFILANRNDWIGSLRWIRLSSNGGDLVEALKIARVIKAIYATTVVPKSGKCVSACFFLFLSGIERYLLNENSLGIHRPYFEPNYFAGLSPPQAEKRQQALTKAVKEFLEESSVPNYLIDKMNASSSQEVYWLTFNDMEALGTHPPWFEELLIAKCGWDKRLETEFFNTPEDSDNYAAVKKRYDANSSSVQSCQEDKIVAPELKKLRSLLEPANPSK